MTAPAPEDEEMVAQYRGVIIIEWPPPIGDGPHGAMLGKLTSITDAMSGRPITTCSDADVVVHVDAEYLITADLTLFADADGEPILERMPVLDGDEIRTGVFPFLVGGMKVREA